MFSLWLIYRIGVHDPRPTALLFDALRAYIYIYIYSKYFLSSPPKTRPSRVISSLSRPGNHLTRSIPTRSHDLVPFLPQLLPLVGRIAFRAPRMNGGDFALERRIHQPISRQRRLLLELRRYDHGRECLSATACSRALLIRGAFSVFLFCVFLCAKSEEGFGGAEIQ